MILLTDEYNTQAELLLHSLTFADPGVRGVSIAYNGYLPDGFTSPYAFYIGDGIDEAEGAAPLFFNEVPIPPYWQLSGTGTSGEIRDYEKLRARIFYQEPFYLRRVRVVDWLDDEGKVRSCDDYNRYGRRMARVIMDGDGHNILKIWTDKKGRDVIYENYPAGEIVLTDYVTDGGAQHVFHSLWEFTLYYLLRSGLDLSRICYNSLSNPFFAERGLWTEHGIRGDDILFWQESVGDELPGNMKLLLEEIPKGGRTQRIMVQSHAAFEKILSLGGSRDVFSLLGYVYPFEAGGENRKAALILTNSDQIEQLGAIVEALPEVTFHIGALTEMSDRLMVFSRYPNVDLQPNITIPAAEKLQRSCGIYLDINHGGKILDAVRTAFLHRIPVLGFENTVHQKNFTAPEAIFHSPDELAGCVRLLLRDMTQRAELIRQQEVQAMAEDPERYRNLW
jgi:accessory Sec system glycosyltransferase GtfB